MMTRLIQHTNPHDLPHTTSESLCARAPLHTAQSRTHSCTIGCKTDREVEGCGASWLFECFAVLCSSSVTAPFVLMDVCKECSDSV